MVINHCLLWFIWYVLLVISTHTDSLHCKQGMLLVNIQNSLHYKQGMLLVNIQNSLHYKQHVISEHTK